MVTYLLNEGVVVNACGNQSIRLRPSFAFRVKNIYIFTDKLTKIIQYIRIFHKDIL